METYITENTATNSPSIITLTELLEHWQGHRALTRRVIDAFPEEQLFQYSIGGMRTFAELTMEMAGLAAPGVRGVAYGDWTSSNPQISHETPVPPTKAGLLALWDEVTALINQTWPDVKLDRLHEHDVAFGMYPGKVYATLFYLIDNEIHHRAQGYVYLRSLGITPPPFWDRPEMME
ncbi:DinB family protein [Dyadobacter sandarakinus]|uniref:Damage-inducible protein DinB n=1 Tax=Dyadobacter sandarakinus TaxID=2747268 RepID=A0ABX7I3U7_9BACT|nr:DinB family protein [Dyadobacter sandarakinus]QRR00475.1 damage-inducible protein DinB [Dyadobacter sandarakinus]